MSDYDDPVREYLAYCKRAAAELTLKGSSLDPKYHPTEAGACKLIHHGGDTSEAKKIRQVFRELTGETTLTATSSATTRRQP